MSFMCAGALGHRVEVRSYEAVDELLRGGQHPAAALQRLPPSEAAAKALRHAPEKRE